MKKFSVLIPAYNAEKYIVECVESVIKQTDIEPVELFDTVEIIIANDGSNDSTGDICDELREKYPNIKVYHNKNQGLKLTRHFLIKKASAQYIIFLDADDKWEDSLLKTLNGYIERYAFPDIISFGFNLWRGENYLPYDRISTLLYCDKTNRNKAWQLILCEDTYNSMWSKVVKRKIFLDVNTEKSLENIRRGEDKIMLIECFEAAQNILFIPDKLYDYRVDNTSMTRAFEQDYFNEVIIVDSFALEKLLKHTSGSEECLIKWGENLVNKFIDYILSAFSHLHKNEAFKCVNFYADADTIKKAVSYAKRSKKLVNKVKAYAISMKLYNLLHFVYSMRMK